MIMNFILYFIDLLGELVFFKIRLCMEGNVIDFKSFIDNYRVLVYFFNFVLF